MQLSIFVKLYEAHPGQFLVRKSYNSDDDLFEVIVSCCLSPGPELDVHVPFSSIEDRDLRFDNFSQEEADAFVEYFKAFFRDNPTNEMHVELVVTEHRGAEKRANPKPLIITP